MSDSKSGDDKKLTVNKKTTLTLKRPEQGTIRQSMSHGRSNSVVVETKKRKFDMPGAKREPA